MDSRYKPIWGAIHDDASKINNTMTGAQNQDHLHTEVLQSPEVNKARGYRCVPRYKFGPGSSIWRQAWHTPAGTIGFYLLAFLAAVLHFVFFRYLDGRILNEAKEDIPFRSTHFSQAYVTTISLALVNTFRAALVASVGICYTQYMWRKLRNDVLEVGLIEELFQVRSNVFRLINFALLRYAPILALVAVFSWVLPVAMIYPPGALVVDIVVNPIPTRFNISTIPTKGAPEPELLALGSGGNFTSQEEDPLQKRGLGARAGPSGFAYIIEYTDEECASSERCLYYDAPTGALRYISKSVLLNTRALDLNHPTSQNSSYTMKFRGPSLQCNDTIDEDIKVWNGSAFEALFNAPKEGDQFKLSPRNWLYRYTAGVGGSIKLQQPEGRDVTLDPCPKSNMGNISLIDNEKEALIGLGLLDDNSTYYVMAANTTMTRQIRTTECVPATSEYDVQVTFSNGRQDITYTITDTNALAEPQVPPFGSRKATAQDVGVLSSYQDYANHIALIDALAENFDLEVQPGMGLSFNYSTIKPYNSTSFGNSTAGQSCVAEWTGSGQIYQNSSSMVVASVFNPARRDIGDNYYAKDLNITEDLLNQALANITISAMTLNQWYDMVDGYTSRTFRVYHFRHKLPFYLPYGLSLALTIPIMCLGLFALHCNGVTAIDGGFIQVLMTTTGATELSRVAAKGCLGGKENVPLELKKMKVRFGELLVNYKMESEAGAGSNHAWSAETDADRTSYDAARETQKVEVCASSGASTRVGDGRFGRRAGFGLVHETDKLEDGVQYGVARSARNRRCC